MLQVMDIKMNANVMYQGEQYTIVGCTVRWNGLYLELEGEGKRITVKAEECTVSQ